VISSHILAELTEMCSEVGIMEKGRLLASGTPGEIRGSLSEGRQIRVRLAGEAEPRSYTVADDEEQTALLRSLLDDDLPVLEFTEVGHGLEDLFMQITTGDVQ
jgi:ABC-2 type transport system ATP-binding protein